MEYYLAIEKNEELTHDATSMTAGNRMLSEGSQSPRTTYFGCHLYVPLGETSRISKKVPACILGRMRIDY